MFSFDQKLRTITPKVEKLSKRGQTNQLLLDALKKDKTFDELLDCYLEKFVPFSRIKKKISKWKLYFYKKAVVNALIELSNISLVTAYFDKNKGLTYYKLTEIANNLLNTSPNSSILEKDRLLEWTYDIGDKQYRSYTWNDTKVQSLLTVDAALIAGVLFVLQVAGNNSIFIGIIPLTLFAISFTLLFMSIVICLIHSIPKMNSKLGNDYNLRAIIGITRFPRLQEAIGDKRKFNALEKYCESIKTLTIDDLITMNATQIVGMAKNNITSHEIIRRGVMTTIVSIYFLFGGTIIVVIQNLNLQTILNHP